MKRWSPAPALSARVEKIRDFVEELDQKGAYIAKRMGSLSDQKPAIPTFYIENRQVIGETMTDQFILTGPLYQLSWRLTDLLSQNFPI